MITSQDASRVIQNSPKTLPIPTAPSAAQQVRGLCTGLPALTWQGSVREANPGQGCCEETTKQEVTGVQQSCNVVTGICQPPVSEAFNSTETMASKIGDQWQHRLGTNDWIPLSTSFPLSRRNTVHDNLQLIEDMKSHLKASTQPTSLSGSRRVWEGGWCSHRATQHCWCRTGWGPAILSA